MDGNNETHDFSLDETSTIKSRLIKNTGMLGGARLISSIIGLLVLIIAVRTLDDKAAFGLLLFIHAYMLFFSEVASFQFWQAIIKFGADDVKAKEAGRLGRLFKTGLIIDALAALAAFIMAASFFGVFIWARNALGFGDGQSLEGFKSALDGRSIFAVTVLYSTVILFRQVNVSLGVLRLFDKFASLALRALVMPVLRLIGVVIGYFQGWGVIELLVVWYVASLVSYLVMQWLAWREVRKRNLWSGVKSAAAYKRGEFPGLYPFVIRSCADSTLRSLKDYFPMLFVMFIFGPALLAVFRIAEEIAKLLSKGIAMFDQVLFPELTRLVADQKVKELMRLTLRAAAGIGLLGFGLSVVVLLFGEQLVTAGFKTGFEDAPPIAVMLLVASSLLGVAIPFYSVFYAIQKPSWAIYVRLAAILAYVVVFVATYKTSGIYAAGWAAIGSAVIEIVFIVFYSRKAAKRV